MSESERLTRLTQTAMAGAAMMLAHQVAGKAARDGLFLSRYQASDLPKMVALAALTALLLGWLFGRLLEAVGPRRAMPVAYLVSGALHLAEWFFVQHSPGAAAVLIYLHIVGLGAILLSGFWSLANEVFDPREAKLRFGRIAGMGTAGGIAGGLLAERTVAMFSAVSVLLLLACLHIACALVMFGVGRLQGRDFKPASKAKRGSARQAFEKAPFLKSLAVLVLLGTTSAALLDYLFKSGATAAFGKGEPLVRYFALFYTGSQVMTFLVQVTLARFSLEKLGLSRTVMTLPLAVGGGASAALLVPMFPMVASVRALELILRGSLFRSGYELFYTPIPARDKRAAKTIIDVGADRLGDALGAGLLALVLWLGPSTARPQILAIAVGLAAITAWITTRMDKAYLGVLERGLINRAFELDIGDVHDSTTMSGVLRSSTLQPVRSENVAPAAPAKPLPGADPVVEALADLRSGDAERVRRALDAIDPWEPLLGPQVVRLLAWDEVCDEARDALNRAGNRVLGQLIDVLLDENQDFAIRRRIPRILARCADQRSVDGLLEATSDTRFEVRFQASRGLDYLKQTGSDLDFDRDRIFRIVERELSVSKPIWDGRKLLDRREASNHESTDRLSFLDEVLRERANQGLEHVFSLLAAVLPRDPLKIAFRALHSEDRLLRGLALEYLEGMLPTAVRDKLMLLLSDSPAPATPGGAAAALDKLMLSNETLLLELRKPSGDALLPASPQSKAKES